MAIPPVIPESPELEMILGKSLKMAFRPNKHQYGNQSTNVGHLADSDKDSSSDCKRGMINNLESNSPTELNQSKRHTEKPFLMKRFGKGLVSNVSDEEGDPLVSEAGSSSPSNLSVVTDQSTATLRIEDKGRTRFKQMNDCTTSVHSPSYSIENRIESNLRMAPWYQEGIPREIALEILHQEPIGSFMVRKSTTKLGCFALSVRVPRSFHARGIAHYLIIYSAKGYRIKGFTKDFPSLGSLIVHHSVMPELLPCPLSLARYHPIRIIADSRHDFADICLEDNAASGTIECRKV
ncbi:uncharacterized protein LOC109537698 isoform X2 [Dendroctonus ponderosae]|uniref:SH2 domain-containing protein n=1 Tax=Dendroctonus ponderosae TaxID=77166 RepID=A0AAR5PGD6_DENPD|nr:uncharacterized protein LOC109537698 isoform X2 [Dendroctonus ponderosae]